MKPSESHKQPTFVIPTNFFQEVSFVDVIVCIVIVFYSEMHSSIDLHLLCIGNRWAMTAE